MLSQNTGGFEDEMEIQDTHKQLLIIDEANMNSLFGKKHLHDTKRLLECKGMSVRNKYAHPYRGFVGSKTLITCNNLTYPLSVPERLMNASELRELENDRYAITSRTITVEMTKSFKREQEFPFTCEQWAWSMLTMAT
jgi:hypothetical protein